MSASISQSNLTSGFIDLATYDELEKYMYGGSEAIAYFVRETRKATWFTQVPVQLAKCEGIANFGEDWSVSISRSGDYLLGTWLHVSLPAVSVAGYNARSVCIAWTPNLMHALVKNCTVSFNDLVAGRFDGTHLDFWAAFTTPTSKAEGYRQMIGSQIPSCGGFIPAQTCDLPLPFFFTRDSGVALPTAALPYNEMRISFSFRDWDELIVGFAPKVDCYQYAVTKPNETTAGGVNVPYVVPAFNTSADGVQPCWNSDIWPSCVPNAYAVPVEPNSTTNGAGDYLYSTDANNAGLRNEYRNSSEMSFIILPKLQGPPTAYLEHSGQHQVTQSGSKNNFNMKNNIPYYVGEPVNKNSDGIYCDMKELSVNCQVWANYAIVSNEERKRMACAPRDMLIEQVQQTPDVDFLIRNAPESRWWPNNIPKLKTVSKEPPISFPAPTVGTSQWCLPDSTSGGIDQNLVNGSAQSGPCAPSATYVADNSVPAAEIWWPNNDVNTIPQQPSGQQWCNNGVNESVNNAAAVGSDTEQWSVSTDSSRNNHAEDNSSSTVSMNLKFAYSVKVLFFAVKNVTAKNIHSNYTIGFPVVQQAATDQVTLDGPVFSKKVWDSTINGSWCDDTGTLVPPNGANPTNYMSSKSGGISKYVGKIQTLTQNVITCKNGFDPLERVSMLYETTPRLGLLDASYYSLIQPYYHAPGIPTVFSPVFCPSGYHMYSYSLEFMSLDPLGSTNYGKLTNVALDAQPIQLNSSAMCPELSYRVPSVNIDQNTVNRDYLFGPINAPGISGDDAQSLKNQSVMEVLINMAYQNIYNELGLETISPWTSSSMSSMETTKASYLGKFKFVATAINNNVLRVSGGSIGFPVL